MVALQLHEALLREALLQAALGVALQLQEALLREALLQAALGVVALPVAALRQPLLQLPEQSTKTAQMGMVCRLAWYRPGSVFVWRDRYTERMAAALMPVDEAPGQVAERRPQTHGADQTACAGRNAVELRSARIRLCVVQLLLL